MSLTIEDGTGVAGANSYATVAEARAYATARGLTLSATDSIVETALVLACDKLESYRYKGTKTTGEQPLAWPREDVDVEGSDDALANDAIPDKLKQAQCQLAVESAAGTQLQPTGTGREVIKQTVDVIVTEYARRGSGSITPEFNKAEAMLVSLLQSGGAFGLTSVRV